METGRLTKADKTGVYRTPWCTMNGCGHEARFYYDIKKLREEARKRTSYLGKLRGTEENPHLLDRIALTADEEDLFYGYLRTAVADVWDALSGFTDCVDKSLSINDGVESVRISELPPYENPVESFKVTNSDPDKYGCYHVVVMFGGGWDGYPYDERIVYVEAEVSYKTSYAAGGVTFENEKSTVCKSFISKMMSNGEEVVVALFALVPELEPAGNVTSAEVFEDVVDIRMVSTSVKLKNPQTIPAGTWVEYQSLDGNTTIYRALQDTDENGYIDDPTLFERQMTDTRGCVVFVLALPKGFNTGVLHPVDTALYEALVNNIIYHWLLLAYSGEAEVYRNLFEEAVERLRSRLQKRKGMKDMRIIPRVY